MCDWQAGFLIIKLCAFIIHCVWSSFPTSGFYSAFAFDRSESTTSWWNYQQVFGVHSLVCHQNQSCKGLFVASTTIVSRVRAPHSSAWLYASSVGGSQSPVLYWLRKNNFLEWCASTSGFDIVRWLKTEISITMGITIGFNRNYQDGTTATNMLLVGGWLLSRIFHHQPPIWQSTTNQQQPMIIPKYCFTITTWPSFTTWEYPIHSAVASARWVPRLVGWNHSGPLLFPLLRSSTWRGQRHVVVVESSEGHGWHVLTCVVARCGEMNSVKHCGFCRGMELTSRLSFGSSQMSQAKPRHCPGVRVGGYRRYQKSSKLGDLPLLYVTYLYKHTHAHMITHVYLD